MCLGKQKVLFLALFSFCLCAKGDFVDSPPWADAYDEHMIVENYRWLMGKSYGLYAPHGQIDASHGIIDHGAIARTVAIGGSGLVMCDSIHREAFTVDLSGKYRVTFNGYIDGEVRSKGEHMTGHSEGTFKTYLYGRIDNMISSRNIAYIETNIIDIIKSPTEYVEEAGKSVLVAIADAFTQGAVSIAYFYIQQFTAPDETFDGENNKFDFSTTAYLIKGNDYKWVFGAQSEITSACFAAGGHHSTLDMTFTLTSVSFEYISPTPIHDYMVTAQAGQNGSISPSGQHKVNHGDDLLLEATPNGGYEVDRWHTKSGIAQTGGNSFTLIDIQEDNSVVVSFKKQPYAGEIVVDSPRNGMVYGAGNRLVVTWLGTKETGDRVKVELLKDGSVVNTLSSDRLNNGRMSWYIAPDTTCGDGYSIRVSSLSSSAYGTSSGTFEIREEYIHPPSVVEIRTLNDLKNFSERIGDTQYPRDARYILMNDIDAYDTRYWNDGKGFLPIGSVGAKTFVGIFDGQGHAISDLDINRGTESYIGMFYGIGNRGTVKNLILHKPYIYGNVTVAALASFSYGTIRNCTIIDGIIEGGSETGGLIAYNYGNILNCRVGATRLYGEGNFAGGIAGVNRGEIRWCKSEACAADWDDSYVGGIAGYNGGVIAECASISNYRLYGGDRVGGIAGWNAGIIRNSYSLSYVDSVARRYLGGIAGDNHGGVIEKCLSAGQVCGGGGLIGRGGQVVRSFWDIQATTRTSPTESGEIDDSNHGKQTSELFWEETYTTEHGADWDFLYTWAIEEGVGYPTLRGFGAPLSRPTGVSASSGLSEGIELFWNAPNEAVVFRIYRADSPTSERIMIHDWIGVNWFLDTTAETDHTYYYWIQAAASGSGARSSDLSDPVSGSCAFPAVQIPLMVRASEGLNSVINVEWTRSIDGRFYRVYRSTDLEGNRTAITGWIEETSFVDNPPENEKPYYYWVEAAEDQNGERLSKPAGGVKGWSRAESLCRGVPVEWLNKWERPLDAYDGVTDKVFLLSYLFDADPLVYESHIFEIDDISVAGENVSVRVKLTVNTEAGPRSINGVLRLYVAADMDAAFDSHNDIVIHGAVFDTDGRHTSFFTDNSSRHFYRVKLELTP